MAFPLFYFELISDCPGYTKSCWISTYHHLECCPSHNLYTFKHFLNPLVLQNTLVTHQTCITCYQQYLLQPSLLSRGIGAGGKYQTPAKAVQTQYKSKLDFSSQQLKVIKEQMLTVLRNLFFHQDIDKQGTGLLETLSKRLPQKKKQLIADGAAVNRPDNVQKTIWRAKMIHIKMLIMVRS